ncbi:Na+/H+ antiporter subunit C [Cytophagaceae bacterium ABcell3]|nr:Na+/H+ antiporter subunit C [Cytophagaceae bacterium ABcell3]
MELVFAIMTGGLYAMAVYMLLRRSIVKLIIGFILLSNATNLLIFTCSRLTRGKTPIIPAGKTEIEGALADPLPQALILTAIVISFGLIAFSIILIKRVYQATGSDDLDKMTSTDTF